MKPPTEFFYKQAMKRSVEIKSEVVFHSQLGQDKWVLDKLGTNRGRLRFDRVKEV